MNRREYINTVATISGGITLAGCTFIQPSEDEDTDRTDGGAISPTETPGSPTRTEQTTTEASSHLPNPAIHYALQEKHLTEPWTEHPDNPILTDQGEPDLLLEDGTFYLYTVDRSPSKIRQLIRLFFSYDGEQFTEHEKSPILSTSSSGWDSVNVSDPSIVKHEGTYFLYFSGAPTVEQSDSQIGVATATSPSGPFKKSPTNPILSPGTGWESRILTEPHVEVQNGTFYMTYTGRNNAKDEAIGLATSSNGIFFTKVPTNPILDLGDINDQCHLYVDGKWHLYYTNKTESRSIYKSVSSDITSFSGASPVLESNRRDYSPAVCYDAAAGEYKMYWHKLGGNSSIELATRPELEDTRIVDQSGNENTGIPGGELLPTPIENGSVFETSSIRFSDGFIRSYEPLVRTDTSDWSASVWVYPTKSGQEQFIMGDPSRRWWEFALDSSDQFQWKIRNGYSADGATIVTRPQMLEQWYFLATSYDGASSSVTAYLGDSAGDDLKTARTETDATQDAWTADLCIGSLGNNDNPFSGRIADVRFYNQFLSQGEIETLYNLMTSRARSR